MAFTRRASSCATVAVARGSAGGPTGCWVRPVTRVASSPFVRGSLARNLAMLLAISPRETTKRISDQAQDLDDLLEPRLLVLPPALVASPRGGVSSIQQAARR